jgi:hypothetical protein
MKKHKQEVITFKVDFNLLRALEGIPNRSEFIRNALVAALEDTCPFCMGTGFLSENQKLHWKEFIKNHTFIVCEECNEKQLVCSNEKTGISDDCKR